jgi:hypothetical protein
MAKWRPRITPAVEAELQSLGPYTIEQSGYLAWCPAPGFEWPWGQAALLFHVDYRDAGDADFRRLMDGWRQVCLRQAEVVDTLRGAIQRGWEWARDNLRAEALTRDVGERVEGGASSPFDQVGGCGFSLGTLGAGQVSMTVQVEVEWDDEHGLEVDLIEEERRSTWSFL